MELQLSGIALKFDAEGTAELCLTLGKANAPRLRQDTLEIKKQLAEGKQYDVAIKRHKEKRSLNANSYMWELLEKMAVKLNTSKDELYAEMLVRYGVFETVTVRKEATDSFIKQWNGVVKLLGSGEIDGKQFNHIRVCFGSSNYDKEQMTRLLKGIVSECQELGIETRTPEEIAQLTSLIEEKKI